MLIKSSKVTDHLIHLRNTLSRAGFSDLSNTAAIVEAIKCLPDINERSHLLRQLWWAEAICHQKTDYRTPPGKGTFSKAEYGKQFESMIFDLLDQKCTITIARTMNELRQVFNTWHEKPILLRYVPEPGSEDSLMELNTRVEFGLERFSDPIRVTILFDLIHIQGQDATIIDFKYSDHLDKWAYLIQVGLYRLGIQHAVRALLPFDLCVVNNWHTGLIKLTPEIFDPSVTDAFVKYIQDDPLTLMSIPQYGVLLPEDQVSQGLKELGHLLRLALEFRRFDGIPEVLPGDLSACELITPKFQLGQIHLEYDRPPLRPVQNCHDCLIGTCGIGAALKREKRFSFMTPLEKVEEIRNRLSVKLPHLPTSQADTTPHEEPTERKPPETLEALMSLKNGRSLMTISHAEKANDSQFVLFSDGLQVGSVRLGEQLIQKGLTPLQGGMAAICSSQLGSPYLLVQSPMSSGKMKAACLFQNVDLVRPDARVLFLVPTRSLAEFTERDLQKIFCKEAHALGIQNLDPSDIVVRHGTSVKISFENARILVATYDYGMELLETYRKADGENPFLDNLGCIVLDEIHWRLRSASAPLICPDFNGAYEMTRIMNLAERLSRGRDAVRLLAMTGTLPAAWYSRFYHNPSFDILSSEFKTSYIKNYDLETETFEGDDSLIERVTEMIELEDGKIRLSPGLLPGITEHLLGDTASKDELKQGAWSSFICIFVFSEKLLKELEATFQHAFPNVDIYRYSAKIQTYSRDRIERRMQMLVEKFEQGQSFSPTILLSTSAIAEGVKLPGTQGIIIRSINVKTGTKFYPDDTVAQMAARFGRFYHPERKGRGAVATLYVKRRGRSSQEETMPSEVKMVLKLAHLGRRWADSATPEAGYTNLARRFPDILDIQSEDVTSAKEQARKMRWLSDNDELTPGGELALFYDAWEVPDNWQLDSAAVFYVTLFNVLIMPFITKRDFRDFFSDASISRGYYNRSDPDYRRLLIYLTHTGSCSTMDQAKVQRMKLAFFNRTDDYDRMEAVVARLLKMFGPNIAKYQPGRQRAREMMSMIAHGLIFIRMDSDGRCTFQKGLYDGTHRFLDELSADPGKVHKTSSFRSIKRFFELTAESENLVLPLDADMQIAKALLLSTEWLKPGLLALRQKSTGERSLYSDLFRKNGKIFMGSTTAFHGIAFGDSSIGDSSS